MPKTFIITGGNTGLGFQCASRLSADRNNVVVLACRNVTAAAPAMGLSFTPERVQIVAEALALVVRIGAPALSYKLPPYSEPAPVFIP